MAPGRDATEFNKIIQADRDKKRKQDLADKIFSRRSSAPAAGAIGSRKPPTGPSSLASRVTKPGQPTKPVRNGNPIAKVQNAASLKRSTSTPQLGNTRRTQALDAAINGRGSRTPTLNNQISIRNNSAARNGNDPGFSIKGVARREWKVVAQNFAPGTSAEDVSSVFVPDPVASGLVECRLHSSNPTVMIELTFNNQDGAEEVVNKYNNKKADNRLLYVWHKPIDPQTQQLPIQPRAQAPASRLNNAVPISSNGDMEMEVPRQPRYHQPYTPPRSNRAQPDVQDGRYGFNDNNVYPAQQTYTSGLVSDGMIGRQGNRRGGGGGGRLFH